MGTTAIDLLASRGLRFTDDGISVCASEGGRFIPLAPRRMVSRHQRHFRGSRLRRQPPARDGAAVARGAGGRTTAPLDDRPAAGECGAGARELGLVVCGVPELQASVRAEYRSADDALPAVQGGVPVRARGAVLARGLDSGENPRSFFAARTGTPPCTAGDRKSTRLNSSHGYISYAVFCLKKKNKELSRHLEDRRDVRIVRYLSERERRTH